MKTVVIILAIAVLITAWPAWGPRSDPAAGATVESLGFFGPAATDPAEVAALARSVGSLEIVHYDVDQASVQRFNVVHGDDGWTIPSHHDYPADGGERVGTTAGSVLGIKREPGALVSDDPRRHEALGVLDPETNDAPAGAERGDRVILSDRQGTTILDLIIGHRVEGRQGWRYVREHGDNEVWMAEMDPFLSTRFSDYVDLDLLGIERAAIRAVVIDPHRVDEMAGAVITAPKTRLERSANNDPWTSPQAPAGQAVDQAAVKTLVDGITGIRLQGVRPLVPEIIGRYGFFFDDSANVWGNEGAVEVQTAQGLIYALFFGEVAPNEGAALTAGLDDAEAEAEMGGDNRYMIVLVRYDEGADQIMSQRLEGMANEARADLADGAELDADAQAELDRKQAEYRSERIASMQKRRDEAQGRFAHFFYVIAGSVFEQLRAKPAELFVEPGDEAAGTDPGAIQPTP